jgi:hypothetical protein
MGAVPGGSGNLKDTVDRPQQACLIVRLRVENELFLRELRKGKEIIA